MFKYVTTVANRRAQHHRYDGIPWTSSSDTGTKLKTVPKGITLSSKRDFRNETEAGKEGGQNGAVLEHVVYQKR